MKKTQTKRINTLLLFGALGVTGVFIFFFVQPVGRIPALGPLLNPFSGILSDAVTAHPQPSKLRSSHLREGVEIFYDERGVPRIFGKSVNELAFAQGYATAKDRLFQMDIQYRSISGRLAEIAGPAALNRDLLMRSVGMPHAAQNFVKGLHQNPEELELMEAYVDGVNTWIDSLTPETLPVEYRLLGFTPEKWSVLKSAFIYKLITWDLSGKTNDYYHSQLDEHFSWEGVEELFPAFPSILQPTILSPSLTSGSRPVPAPPENPFPPFSPNGNLAPFTSIPQDGSNAWAVSGEKSNTGKPLLASDPHLGLQLPSVWYEAQLHAPDFQVYGVQLVGLPLAAIGFNSSIAWGVTSGATDVLDWYAIQFKDETREEYWHDGEWKKTQKITEEIRIKGRESVIREVVYTHHGPVVRQEHETDLLPPWVPPESAMRWTGHDVSNNVATFLALGRSKDMQDMQNALHHFHSPTLNFAITTAQGDIAMVHAGQIPLRWSGQGRRVMDGTRSETEWHEFIPFEDLPKEINPPRQFVSSANTHPVDATYPYQIHGNYASFERGTRIHELLSADSLFSTLDFKKFQMDIKNLHAERALRIMVPLLRSQELSDDMLKASIELKTWNATYSAQSAAPSIFEAWWNEIEEQVWNMPFKELSPHLITPSKAETLVLLEKKASTGDAPHIPGSLEDLVNGTFQSAVNNLTKEHGPYGSNWNFGQVRPVRLPHIARVPGFGAEGLSISGNGNTLNAMKENHGPSWRMVVEFSATGVQAWGIYPGGQSGNPLRPEYQNFLPAWSEGVLHSLKYWHSIEEARTKASERMAARDEESL